MRVCVHLCVNIPILDTTRHTHKMLRSVLKLDPMSVNISQLVMLLSAPGLLSHMLNDNFAFNFECYLWKCESTGHHTHIHNEENNATQKKNKETCLQSLNNIWFFFFWLWLYRHRTCPAMWRSEFRPLPYRHTYIYLNFHFQPSATKLTAFFLWRMCHKINKYRDGLCRRVSPDIWTVGPISNGYSINLQSLLHPIPHQPSSPTPRYMLQCC